MNVLEQADNVSKLRDWSWHNIYQFRMTLLFIKKRPLMVQYPFNIWMNSPYAYPQRFRGFLDRDTIFLLEHQADSVLSIRVNEVRTCLKKRTLQFAFQRDDKGWHRKITRMTVGVFRNP